jgi:hypothetical protein
VGLSWPSHIRTAMSAAHNVANLEAMKHEGVDGDELGFRLRVLGRLNGIEDALIELSKQIEEQSSRLESGNVVELLEQPPLPGDVPDHLDLQ